jgi:hypothetical protein
MRPGLEQSIITPVARPRVDRRLVVEAARNRLALIILELACDRRWCLRNHAHRWPFAPSGEVQPRHWNFFAAHQSGFGTFPLRTTRDVSSTPKADQGAMVKLVESECGAVVLG